MAIPAQQSIWDDRRNTSMVHPPPPNALPDALQALAQFRRSDPARVKWIEDGYPTLTDAEHVARFGAPYKGHRARR